MSVCLVDPVIKTIRVQANQRRAFAVFTEGVGRWWSRTMSANSTKAAIAEIIMEPRVGGRWFERGVDGSECSWGTVRVWEPPARLVVDWRVGADFPTEVEVRFTAITPDITEVRLEHRLNRDGAEAERWRGRFDQGWSTAMRRYGADVDEAAQARRAADGARAVTDGETVLATMEIGAPPERLFRALTTSETEIWWGAQDLYCITDWRADVRPGGAWSLNTRLPDGSVLPGSGTFLSVEPHKIVLTRRYDFDFPELGRRETEVTYRLDPAGCGTRVTIRQDGFAGLWTPALLHAEGWERFLGFLAAYVEAAKQ